VLELSWRLAQIAVALVLVCAAAVLYLRVWLRGKQRGAGPFQIEPLSSLGLGPGASLQLVKVRGSLLLLGVGSGGVRVLREWPEGEIPPSDPADSEPTRPEGPA
jgi:flagellar biogenesis protein FliO